VLFDGRFGYASLAAVQQMVNRGNSVMSIELRLKDIAQSEKAARKIEHMLGGRPYDVEDWYQINRKLFTTVFGDRRL
jgi:ABC-type lipoprotein release transport system permease subunit